MVEESTSPEVAAGSGEAGVSALEEYLDKDADEHPELSFGKVWEGMKAKQDDKKINEQIGFANTDNVTDYRISIDLMHGRHVIAKLAKSRASRSAMNIKSFLKRQSESLPSSLADYLERLVEQCNKRAQSRDNTEADKEADEQEKRDEEKARNRPEIYVYTLPHYEKHPVVEGVPGKEESKRTFYKVGRTGKDIRERVMAQATGLPETPIVRRRYFHECDNDKAIKELEGAIHSLLVAADHRRVKGSKTEWFCTSLIFLDLVAHTLGLARFESHSDN